MTKIYDDFPFYHDHMQKPIISHIVRLIIITIHGITHDVSVLTDAG